MLNFGAGQYFRLLVARSSNTEYRLPNVKPTIPIYRRLETKSMVKPPKKHTLLSALASAPRLTLHEEHDQSYAGLRKFALEGRANLGFGEDI